MIKALKPYTTIQGCSPLAWNYHDGCYGDMEGCVGDLENVFGLFTFVHGNFSALSLDVSALQGKVSNLSGPIHISGRCNRIRGNIGGYKNMPLYGDVSMLAGDMTGIFGCCTGKSGCIDDCGLTDEDRADGVNIEDLVME